MIATATTVAPLLVREIGTEFLTAARAIVDTANRKAERAGIEQRFEVAFSSTTVAERVGAWDAEIREVTTFVVLGEPLRLAGWEFVATITWDSETGLAVTRVVPGAEVDLAAHRDAQVCEHCNTRRARKDTYVVREVATGRTVQVGSSCLTAFLGIDPSAALWFVGEDFGSRGEFDGFGQAEIRPSLAWVVGLASAAVAEYGWVPASAYSGTPTRDIVNTALFPRTSGAGGRIDAEIKERLVTRLLAEGSVAQERADAVIAWVRSGLTGSSEYVLNLQAAFAGETVSRRNLGLVVSAISSWSKAQEREIERAAKATRPASTHVGQVGDKIALDVVVEGVRFIEGQYGTTTLLTLVDAAGNVFKWFASGTKDYALGTALKGTGTVKKHDEFKDSLQTVVTRCKF